MRVSVNWRTGQAGALRSATFDAQARNKFSTRRRCGTTRIAFFAFVAGSRAKQFLRRGGLVRDHKTNRKRAASQFKSRFIEMFDSEKFELVKLGDYCERVTKGATPTTLGYRYQDNGINFIKVESLAEDGSIIADKVAHISDECNDAMRRSQLRTGDIVFSIAGAIGRTAIIPDSVLPANTNQALAIIRLRNPLAFDRIFLRYALISSDVTRSISSSKRGIAQVNLSLTDIKNLRVPLPPLALQQEFANFVSQVDKLRFATQQQIDKLETLKKSLMQEYFE